MSETWLHSYILLAFRIHRLIQKAYDCPFVEAYYGPPEWRTQVESEPELEASEFVLKEQHLYRNQGYIEQSICLTLCPQCVIQEGIATLAHEMIFAEGEAEQWLVEHVYRPLHKDIDAVVLLRLRQASQLLGSVWDNAALLLDEGRSEQEVAHYFTKYMLLAGDRAAQMVAHLKHPIWGRYELTYANGQKLMRPWLQGPGRHATFRRFLTEQFTPSQLEENTLTVQA
jgi:hypothetical protein